MIMKGKDFENIIKDIKENVSDKYIKKNISKCGWDFINSVPKKDKTYGRIWFPKGIVLNEDPLFVVIRAGYSEGTPRALGYNFETKELEIAT